jgi:hypothetical protein
MAPAVSSQWVGVSAAQRGRVPSVFDSVKVFSATVPASRAGLGEVITTWLHANRSIKLVDLVVRQSSDAEFHCLTIVAFYCGS